MEVDEPVIVTSVDCYDSVIKTKRDLEDFCRLSVQTGFDLSLLRSGEFKIGLKFRNFSTPRPIIRIWENTSWTGNLDYLNDDATAAAQIQCTTFGETLTSPVIIPTFYWALHDSNVAHLIFEGTEKGTGELVVCICNKDGLEIGEAGSTWIKLMDVKEMYQRARIVNEAEQIPDPSSLNPNPPPQAWSWDPSGNPYVEDPEAASITAIFVHGWRMKYTDFQNYSDTSYKRLWHQGFKGKFYSFRWATFSGDNNGLPYGYDEILEHTKFPPGGLTYDASEYRAWLCGPALAAFVNQLPNPSSQKKLFAHSMGNVIAGSALRSGMVIDSYALCNAAMAAMAYDPNPILKKNFAAPNNDLSNIFLRLTPHTTPDTDPDPAIRDSFGLEDKFTVGSVRIKFNFGLPQDSALGSWTANNLYFKPDHEGSYYYQEVPQPPNISYKLFQAPPNGINPREVTNLPEAMGYVTKFLTRAVGADLRTQGSIQGFQDMSGWGPSASHSGFGDTHSAQWRWNNQSTCLFWKMLVDKLELK